MHQPFRPLQQNTRLNKVMNK